MIHQNVNNGATSISAAAHMPVKDAPDATPSLHARLMSALTIFALPFVLVWCVAAWVFSDIRAVGRAIRQFHRDAADEYSRLS